MKDKRYIAIIVLLCFAAVLSILINLSKREPLNTSILDFPKVIGDYISTEVPLKDRIYEILETRNVVMREYVKGNEPPILFYLIFSPKTYKASDPPENCITGDGLTILEKSEKLLPITIKKENINLKLNKLVAEKGGNKHIYLYWFIAGNEFFGDYFGQRAKLIKAYFTGRPLSGGQVRISTSIKNNNSEEAFNRLKEFIEKIMPYLEELLS